MKKCNKCLQEKLRSEFSISNRQPDGLQNYCKSCSSEYFKTYRDKRKAEGVVIQVQSKVCASCKMEKPRSQFTKRVISKDGLNGYCKPCWRNYFNNRKRPRS